MSKFFQWYWNEAEKSAGLIFAAVFVAGTAFGAWLIAASLFGGIVWLFPGAISVIYIATKYMEREK